MTRARNTTMPLSLFIRCVVGLFSSSFVSHSVLATTEISRHGIVNGSNVSASDHHEISGAIGEGLVGSSTSEHHEITWGFFAFVGQPCAVNAVCDDKNVCTFDNCTNTLCAYSTVRYGDVNGSGASGGAAIPNLDDILCVLQGFSNFNACMNGDIAPPCAGNELINLDDLLAVLAAYSGVDSTERIRKTG